MKTNILKSLVFAAGLLSLCACRVETNTESVPEAEGSGKKAINIRVEPLSRQEIKDVTNTTIDRASDAASVVREAASSAVDNAQRVGKSVTTLTEGMVDINFPGKNDATVTTVTQVTTETE